MKNLRPTHIRVLKTIIHLSALYPFILTFYQAVSDQLGGDPVEALLHFTGIGAFNLLLISLSVSLIAKRFKVPKLMQVRRLVGLYAFFYALAHILSFIFFELQLEWGLIISEIVKRPYITVGFAAYIILFAMALTSTKSMQRKLGAKWQTIHNWVYLSALLIALHYIWSVKSDLIQPAIYWALLLIILFMKRERIIKIFRPNKKNTKTLA